MRTSAVLPVKSFARAKQRLGDALEEDARRGLAQAMVGDVLAALIQVGGLAEVVVVTGEPWAADAAWAAGARVVPDADEHGQSAAAERGIAVARGGGADRVLLVPGDCPLLDPGELDALLASAPAGPSVLIVPDRHGEGTNALLISPPGAIAPAFGPGSLARHVARAREAGAAVEVAAVPSLELDVDTAQDLVAVRSRLGDAPGGGERTRAALERLAAVAG